MDCISFAGQLFQVFSETYHLDSERATQTVVRPVHSSLRDYLCRTQKTDNLVQFRLAPGSSHKQLANTTLDYIQTFLEKSPGIQVPLLFYKDPAVDVAYSLQGVWSLHKPSMTGDERAKTHNRFRPQDFPQHRKESVYAEHPLLQHALVAGLHHFHKSQEGGSSFKFRHALLKPDTKHHDLWLESQCRVISGLSGSAGATLAHVAALLGYVDLLKHFIHRSKAKHHGSTHRVTESTDKKGRTPLFYASIRAQFDVIEYLLSEKANVNARDCIGQSPLHIACAAGNNEIVDMMLRAGAATEYDSSANVGSQDETKRFSMLDEDVMHRDMVHHKVLMGGIYLKNRTGRPLHIAANYNHLAIVKLLLQNGADVNATNDVDQTALHRAADTYADHSELCRHLASAGVDVTKADISGYNALHLATFECMRNTETIETLISIGIPVDSTTEFSGKESGMTALLIACSAGNDSLGGVFHWSRREYQTSGLCAPHSYALVV